MGCLDQWDTEEVNVNVQGTELVGKREDKEHELVWLCREISLETKGVGSLATKEWQKEYHEEASSLKLGCWWPWWPNDFGIAGKINLKRDWNANSTKKLIGPGYNSVCEEGAVLRTQYLAQREC